MGNLDKSEDAKSQPQLADNLHSNQFGVLKGKSKVLADWYKDGIRIVVLTVRGSHFCAYVGIPDTHPLSGFGYDDIDLECHGGLTFAGELKDIGGYYFYGWDYAHSGDRSHYEHYGIDDFPSFSDEHDWTLGEVKQEAEEVAYYFKKLANLAERIAVGTTSADTTDNLEIAPKSTNDKEEK